MTSLPRGGAQGSCLATAAGHASSFHKYLGGFGGLAPQHPPAAGVNQCQCVQTDRRLLAKFSP